MMEVKEMALPSLNAFASDYINSRNGIEEFFHYGLRDVNLYEKRYGDLMERRFDRSLLAEAIENYMGKFGISEEVSRNIEKLKREDAVVVIGGQQAGLLTGPLYTIHKAISVIKHAEEQERRLGKPVIPVFWIAGEDHDLDEVNHVYVERQGQLVKETHTNSSHWQSKAMISDIPFGGEEAKRWLEKVFSAYRETAYTKDLYQQLIRYSEESESVTDFFSFMINDLFKKSGLLLVDSGDKSFRKVQSEFFIELVRNQESINAAVKEQQSHILNKGYSRAIDMNDKNANLFVYVDKERILLEKEQETGHFKGKSNQMVWTESELLKMAECEPEMLSNNVVTRPMMQEHLFPVLSFISGPGEIAYWAELKLAFEVMGMKMPVLVPRMNLTIIEPGVDKALDETECDLYEILTKGTDGAVERYLAGVMDTHLEMVYQQMERQLTNQHQLYKEAALHIDRGLEPMLQKNLAILKKQLRLMNDRVIRSQRTKHEWMLSKFKTIETALHPNGGPQERTLNICYFLNEYGPEFVDGLLKLPLEINPMHKLIFMKTEKENKAC